LFKTVWNNVNKPDFQQSTELDVIDQLDLNDYVTWTGMTNVSNPDETNCMMECMSTSKCVGYAWNIDGDGKCRLYSKLVTGSESTTANEFVAWACSTNGFSSGVSCDWNDLLTSNNQQLGNSNGNTSLQFRPDPSCPVFSDCNGKLVPGI
jgi:hypothetical protein